MSNENCFQFYNNIKRALLMVDPNCCWVTDEHNATDETYCKNTGHMELKNEK